MKLLTYIWVYTKTKRWVQSFRLAEEGKRKRRQPSKVKTDGKLESHHLLDSRQQINSRYEELNSLFFLFLIPIFNHLMSVKSHQNGLVCCLGKVCFLQLWIQNLSHKIKLTELNLFEWFYTNSSRMCWWFSFSWSLSWQTDLMLIEQNTMKVEGYERFYWMQYYVF